MSEKQPDSDLVAMAVSGNREAFSVLCNRHKARLWRITAGVARGADAEDLAQEAIVRAWCAIETCKRATSFEAWICRIAVNAAYDYHRSAWKRRIVFTGSSEIEAPSEESLYQTAERREIARRLRRAVAALPQRQCVPIWMHYFEQFSVAEIAELEQIAESTVRSRIQVGMRRLRNSLDDLIAEHEPMVNTTTAVKGLQI